MTDSLYDVIGLGNALVDILVFVDEQFLSDHNLTKSSMLLCTQEDQSQLLNDLSTFSQSSGGSAANTVASLAGLKNAAGLIGSVSSDEWGTFYKSELQSLGVAPLIETVEGATGTSIVMITPDSERTMNTHLGSASTVPAHSFLQELSNTRLLYIEGYAYDTDDQKYAAQQAIERVHDAGNVVAISLSDAGCVERHHEDFLRLLKNVDIVVGNESEFCQLFGIPVQEITHEILSNHKHMCSNIAVITQSARGCTVMDSTSIFSVEARVPSQLVDLTGAGDQFTAGFLHGLLHDKPLLVCAQYGIELATRVIAQVGSRLEISDLDHFMIKNS
jgi:sugar/nucleoside kinase (ribokinase family)